MKTAEQAIEMIAAIPQEELAEICIDLSKSVNGFKFRHLWNASREELVSFFVDHYDWNAEKQEWNFKQWVEDIFALENEIFAEPEQPTAWEIMCSGD